ncbi:hypothetical protein D3C72_2434340 [compost metagenome]
MLIDPANKVSCSTITVLPCTTGRFSVSVLIAHLEADGIRHSLNQVADLPVGIVIVLVQMSQFMIQYSDYFPAKRGSGIIHIVEML